MEHVMIELITTWPPEIFDFIGVAGFGLYVLNYTLLTLNKMQSQQVSYFAINWLAASMVLIGLFNTFNLASALIQIFWIGISSVGMVIRLRNSRKIAPVFASRRAY